jgi:hypothetical protein
MVVAGAIDLYRRTKALSPTVNCTLIMLECWSTKGSEKEEKKMRDLKLGKGRMMNIGQNTSMLYFSTLQLSRYSDSSCLDSLA